MPTYTLAPSSVPQIANGVLCRHETHKPLLNAKVKIDYLFARACADEDNAPIDIPIKVRGHRAWAQCRIINLKDRAKGNADAEILIDGDHWDRISLPEQEAILDHELHHLSVIVSRQGAVRTDDLNRPKLKLRKHDIEFGWFTVVAERNGEHSVERQQAKSLMDNAGQYYWPELAAK